MPSPMQALNARGDMEDSILEICICMGFSNCKGMEIRSNLCYMNSSRHSSKGAKFLCHIFSWTCT